MDRKVRNVEEVERVRREGGRECEGRRGGGARERGRES